MRKRFCLIVSILLCSLANLFADIQWTVKGNEVLLENGEGVMRVQLCMPDMFRVTKDKCRDFRPDEQWMVIRYDFDPVQYEVRETRQGVAVMTGVLTLLVSDSPWRIRVIDRATDEVLYEETDCQLAAEGRGPKTTCVLRPDEHFFGLGERMDQLDLRGQRVHLNVELGRGPRPAVGGKDILRANYCPVPWVMSNKGYGIFFHTAWPSDWDMGWTSNQTYSWQADGGELDYYFVKGPEIQKMIHSYQMLTGNCPMMPRSAYGLHLGSYSGGTWNHEQDANQHYNVALVQRMRKEGIPVDILWLDSTWRIFNSRFRNGGCNYNWQLAFPEPKGMIDSIYAEHIDLFGLHVRSIADDGPSSTLYQDALAAGALFPGMEQQGIFNFFDEEKADWWWQHGPMRVVNDGVKFFKTDVGSAFRYPGRTDSVIYEGYTGAELHNLFPLAYGAAPYKRFIGQNRMRGFTHTREGYAGIQRYPFIWAGDWGTEWQWFEPVIRGGLTMALSGVGYWSHCMGGFEQYSPYDTDLYLRWCQFGMFSPVAMLFGMDHPRYHEPWTYGEEAQRIFTTYDSLRYTLIPYLYSNAWEMMQTSRPLMAPMLYDWQNDEVTYRMCDQFMFGHSMMICPVTNKGALSRPVYFPGGKWVDFWTGERIDGRQWKSFLTPQWLMPIFIRQDAIIVKQPEVQWMAQSEGQPITVCCYPVSSSSYDLYEDDGRSLDYQQGAYALTCIDSKMVYWEKAEHKRNDNMCDWTSGCEWTLTISKPDCPAKDKKGRPRFTPSAHSYCVEAYLDSKPTSITVNGTERNDWTWDETLRLLRLDTGLDNTEEITIIVNTPWS